MSVRPPRHVVSLAGAALTTVSAVLFLVVLVADFFALHANPYLGIVFFVVLPAIFLAGLALMPLGAWLERRRLRQGRAPSALPRIDLNDPIHQRAIAIGLTLTIVNIVIVSLAAHRSIEYMDSVQFCGQVCHTVMKPEFTAHEDGPHARVLCVACHIGPGAIGFAKAKMSGTRQLVAIARHTYARPIPTPVRRLSPARDTCEQCHWPEKFHGEKLRRVVEYGDDEKNTESVTALQLHVGGGGGGQLGIAQGIHWHMNVGNEVEYIATDGKREVIPWVRLTDRLGGVREYAVDGVTAEQLAKGERRRMDCMDCHNRPSHGIAATAERAVDETLARGGFPNTLPFVRREAVKALKASYPTEAAAASGIAGALREFYRTQPAATSARAGDIDRSVRATTAIYRRNVFPEMNVGFGTYPSHLGHVDSPGCFRCHDDDHKTKAGKAIGQDCETCHTIE